jgi:predicted phage terminase large subunit-like protein
MGTVYCDNFLYILDSTSVHKELPALVRFTESYKAQHDIHNKNIAVRIEPKASGKSLKQTLITQGVNAIETPAPTDDKVARVMNCSPFVEAGRCWLIEGNWNEPFLNQCATFPNGAHDDEVDNLTNAISHYNKKKPQLFAG